MACIDKASCGKENACDNIQIGDVVTVKETRGQGDSGVEVVRAINDDGTLRVKYTIGGGTRAPWPGPTAGPAATRASTTRRS